MSSARIAVAAVVAAACGGGGGGGDDAHPKKPLDKATIIAQDAGIQHDAPPPLDPSGMHLDDYVPGAGRPAPKRAGRPVDVTLRSSPPGASVAVDGINLGPTPQLWTGETGPHEFTFTLPGHALARYRFHVISSGVVHGRLDPVATETDAGVPPPELVPPSMPSTINDPIDGPKAVPVDAAVAPAIVIDAPPPPPAVDAAPAVVPPPAVDAATGLGPQP